MILLGTICASSALTFFLFPHHIAPGGIMGVSDMLYSATSIPAGTWYALVNIPLFLAGLRLNREFFFKSLLGAAFNTLFLNLLVKFDPNMLGLEKEDLFLCALFGGILLGIGYGLVLRAGGSSGGTDIAGWLIRRRWPQLKLGRAILFFDLAIICIQCIVYHSIKLSLYAIIGMFLCSKMIDFLADGGQAAKITFIISEKKEEISARIMAETGRGVTLIPGTGMYTGNERNLLLCTMHRHDVPHIKKIIRDIDPAAFVILSDAHEVTGEGFTPIKK